MDIDVNARALAVSAIEVAVLQAIGRAMQSLPSQHQDIGTVADGFVAAIKRTSELDPHLENMVLQLLLDRAMGTAS